MESNDYGFRDILKGILYHENQEYIVPFSKAHHPDVPACVRGCLGSVACRRALKFWLCLLAMDITKKFFCMTHRIATKCSGHNLYIYKYIYACAGDTGKSV